MYEFILSNPGYRYEIRGHTDSTGSPEHNKILSQSRAEAVRTYLIDRGISGTRLTATGLGSLEPLENNATEEGRKRNRRTELKILDLK
jgi:outer membrane protein OmpA-like peptidoglycan-associated protein